MYVYIYIYIHIYIYIYIYIRRKKCVFNVPLIYTYFELLWI